MAHKLINWAAQKSGSVKASSKGPGQADWNKLRVFGLHGKSRVAGWNRYAAKTSDAERLAGPFKVHYRALELKLTGNEPIRPASGFEVFCLTCVALDCLGSMFREIHRGKFRNAAGNRNRFRRAINEGYRFFAEARSYNDFSHLALTADESRKIIFERHEQERAQRKEMRRGKKKARRVKRAQKRAESKCALVREGEQARARANEALAALKMVG